MAMHSTVQLAMASHSNIKAMLPSPRLVRLLYYCGIAMIFYFLLHIANRTEQSHQLKQFDHLENIDISTLGALEFATVETNANSTTSRYFVRSSKCAMPYVDPYVPEVVAVYQPKAPCNCTDEQPVLEKIFDVNRQKYLLHINVQVAQGLKNYSGDISCCYKEIVRATNSDSEYTLSPCIGFEQDFLVPTHIGGILTTCFSANSTLILQEDGFTFIQIKQTNQTINQTAKSTKSGEAIRKPSVLLLGIDSMSRINFRRTMPKTYEFIRKRNWHEMQGYNKVGDNTFPNLMAVFAGYNESTADEKCVKPGFGGFDKCPFVWYDFQKAGYRTSYSEDWCQCSTFNFLKYGFAQPPTDYYIRPYMLAFEQHLPEQLMAGLQICLGHRHNADFIYDYGTELRLRYAVDDPPVFGFSWTNSFSHNAYDTPSSMDHVMLALLEQYETSGILDNTIVILFSDHGSRYGSLNHLTDGFFEERLPMLFFWLPQWFVQKYPIYAHALEMNRNRLATPFDLYMTLRHLLALGESDEEVKLQPADDCAHCLSMFHELPEERSCEEACIPDHFCTCTPYAVISTTELVTNVTRLLVEQINEYLLARNLSEPCSPLELDRVKSVERRIILENDPLGYRPDHENTYRIHFGTRPNDADFQATVIHHELPNTVSVDVEHISRLNSYDKDAQCINDKQAKKYCICKSAVAVKENKS